MPNQIESEMTEKKYYRFSDKKMSQSFTFISRSHAISDHNSQQERHDFSVVDYKIPEILHNQVKMVPTVQDPWTVIKIARQHHKKQVYVNISNNVSN